MTTRPSVSAGPGLKLFGVDHLAHVTWKPGETADFYREVLGLPLTHAVTGVGWLSEDFPDFVHFFLGLGGDNYLAFFYFFDLPEDKLPDELMHLARHIALHVDTEEELLRWRDRSSRTVSGSPHRWVTNYWSRSTSTTPTASSSKSSVHYGHSRTSTRGTPNSPSPRCPRCRRCRTRR